MNMWGKKGGVLWRSEGEKGGIESTREGQGDGEWLETEKQDAGRQQGRREVKAEGGMRNVRPEKQDGRERNQMRSNHEYKSEQDLGFHYVLNRIHMLLFFVEMLLKAKKKRS